MAVLGKIIRKSRKDIKFEFGRVEEYKHIALIDEISGGNMRAYRDGQYIEPLKLEQLLLK
jgi:phosphoribosylaminoimidazole-succinocarboxamide synthase